MVLLRHWTAPELHASSDVREPTYGLLHQAVLLHNVHVLVIIYHVIFSGVKEWCWAWLDVGVT